MFRYAKEPIEPSTDLLSISLPSSSSPPPLNTYGDRYLIPRLPFRRGNDSVFRFAAIASLLAISYIVVFCGFRRATKAHSLRAGRTLAGGSGDAAHGDSCTPHSASSSSDVDSGSSPPPQSAQAAAAASAEEEAGNTKPPQKRKRTTSESGDSHEEQQGKALRSEEPAASGPLDPHVDTYITEALESGSDFEFAEWLLNPEEDFPSNSSSEEEEEKEKEEEETPLSSPGEGTSAATQKLLSAAKKAQTDQPPESPHSPGEGPSGYKGEATEDAGAEHAPGDEPATSSSVSAEAGAPQHSSSPAKQQKPLETHPFYRHPEVVPAHIVVKEIKPKAGTQCLCHKQLNTLRELLKKKTLSQPDVDQMVGEASTLLSYARGYMDKDISGLASWKTADCAALMLVVVDTLFTVGTVLGPRSGPEKWLPALMQLIPRKSAVTVRRSPSLKTESYLEDVRKILGALEFYRVGLRPPAHLLVPLKRKILCTSAVWRFRQRAWHSWKDDDKEWQQSD